MTSHQRLAAGVVLVVVLIGGGLLAIGALGGGGGAAATPSPVAAASVSPTATSPVTAPPTASPSATTSPSASASGAPSATPGPTPSPAPGEPATILVSGLKLDAKEDPDGKDRSIGFHADGTGDVTAKVAVLSPQGNVVMCLGAGQEPGQPDCNPSSAGTLTAVTPAGGGDFVLTLRGEDVETPVVDVTITFPATAPAVIIAGARFDGTGYPETNGITAIVTPRRNGDLSLAADWGGHPFLYQVELSEQGGPGSQVLADQGPATRMAETLPVTAPNPWKLVLENTEQGFGPTDLDATIAWP